MGTTDCQVIKCKTRKLFTILQRMLSQAKLYRNKLRVDKDKTEDVKLEMLSTKTCNIQIINFSTKYKVTYINEAENFNTSRSK